MSPLGHTARVLGLLTLATTALSDTVPPTRIPAPGGAVAITSAREQEFYDKWNFAPARRAGDYVYVSGVVVWEEPGAPRTPETFKAATRTAFQTLRNRLRALGADFPDVVMMNTFHDWSAPEFKGDRGAQFEAFLAVKREFMSAPHPAWTAVGTSSLIREGGVVEVQMIAYAPQARASPTAGIH
jgi:enamine deaminase RidA (YjgF/YER057c/UK114 family)